MVTTDLSPQDCGTVVLRLGSNVLHCSEEIVLGVSQVIRGFTSCFLSLRDQSLLPADYAEPTNCYLVNSFSCLWQEN